jgi:hypothetical protein
MAGPEPLVIPWRGRSVRVRHDDPYLGLYTDVGKRLSAAVQLASDVEGLRLVLASTVPGEGRGRRSNGGTAEEDAPKLKVPVRLAASPDPGGRHDGSDAPDCTLPYPLDDISWHRHTRDLGRFPRRGRWSGGPGAEGRRSMG